MRFISRGALPRAASARPSAVHAPALSIATDTALRTVFGHTPMPKGTALSGKKHPRDRGSPGIRFLFSRQNTLGKAKRFEERFSPLLKNPTTSALPYSTS